MKEFDELLNILDNLFGPNGCPWDKEQTMISTRPCVIEEGAELIEAIDSGNNEHIKEELGDLFFVAVFMGYLAQKENRCSFKEVLETLNEKIIRRHPHVFSDSKIENTEQVLAQWNAIKKKEKEKQVKKSALDSIPKGLPALARAQKVSKKMLDVNFSIHPKQYSSFKTEQELGETLLALVLEAQNKGIDSEHALRKVLASYEGAFRAHEAL